MTDFEPRRRLVWFAGDPEPTVGQKCLIAGTVWMRHPQLRWIAAPGGNGCMGLEWRRLVDHDEIVAVEVFDDEPYKPYGGLIRTPAPEPVPAPKPQPAVAPVAASVDDAADGPAELWASYRDQSCLSRPERSQDQRYHVADASGCARCDGAILIEEYAHDLPKVYEVLRCKKRGCKELWPAVAP